MLLEAHLAERVRSYLSLYQYDTAKFVCERLVAGFPNEVCVVGWCARSLSGDAGGVQMFRPSLSHLSRHPLSFARRSLPTQDNVYLLATCYKLSDQAYRAYHLLKGF